MEIHGETLKNGRPAPPAAKAPEVRCLSCGRAVGPSATRCPNCGQAMPVAAAPALSAHKAGAMPAGKTAPPPPIYTNCAWQRPDGRWLSSKEMAEMEDLARQYAGILRAPEAGLIGAIGKLFGARSSRASRIETIRARVTALGIEFGVFQAYAQALRQ